MNLDYVGSKDMKNYTPLTAHKIKKLVDKARNFQDNMPMQ